MNELLTKGIGHTEFKDSPVGKIPVGWEVVKLHKVCEIKGRIGFRGYTKEDLVKKEFGALTIGAKHIRDNKLFLDDPEYLSWKKYEESPEIMVNNGDILFVQRGSLGKVALIKDLNEEATINPSMVLLKNIKINEEFTYYVLLSNYIQNEVNKIMSTTAIPMVSQQQIKNFYFPLPQEYEQKKIASILTSVDEVIEKTQSQINKLQDMKKGTMNELLTKGIGHTEFKDSPVGKIPVGWEVRIMDSLTVLMTNGFVGSAAKHYCENGVPYLRSTNVRSNRLEVDNLIYIREEFHKESSRSQLQTGDLLTVQSGHIGTSAVVTEEFNETNCHALIVSRFLEEKVSSKFIAYYFNSDLGMGRLSGIFVGSTIKHINTKDLKKFEVIVPPLPEQKKIASILTSVDSHIEEKQRKLEQTQSLKKSLMQDLLTGKVRVTVN